MHQELISKNLWENMNQLKKMILLILVTNWIRVQIVRIKLKTNLLQIKEIKLITQLVKVNLINKFWILLKFYDQII